jgi:hypothetical protein
VISVAYTTFVLELYMVFLPSSEINNEKPGKVCEKFEWKCEGRKIERVSEFKYLGHTFNETATDKPHSEEGKQDSGMCVGNGKKKVGR